MKINGIDYYNNLKITVKKGPSAAIVSGDCTITIIYGGLS